MTPLVLSIQSRVAYGHVGNGAAVLPLQRMGFEVITLDTVQLAHHPGYGGFVGRFEEPALLGETLGSLERIGVLQRCVAVLSGYLGTAAMADVVEDAVRRVRRLRPDALYCCDPVIGDTHTGVFVRPGIEEVFRERLAPVADLLVPNVFELARLSGLAVADQDGALRAADRLRERGAAAVVASGLPVAGQAERIGMLAVDGEAAWLVATARRPLILHGTGDAFSALVLGHRLGGRSLAEALAAAAAAMAALVDRTVEEGGPELALIAAQDDLLKTSSSLVPVRLR